jgi:hypothetical protein
MILEIYYASYDPIRHFSTLYHPCFHKNKHKEHIKISIALCIGAVVWTAFKFHTPFQDPTELLSYWKIGYPISVLFSGIMGIFFPDRPWRWGISIIWIQFLIGLIAKMVI